MAQAAIQRELPAVVQQKLRHVRSRYPQLCLVGRGGCDLRSPCLPRFGWDLLVDWLFEPPPGVRIAGMAIVAVALLWIAYHYLLRRVFRFG